ncbi:hypothetical protein D3218_13630 [Aureimonas flava]|uniref:Uncharacterized protein n=1 Tax=Aureimonas flava TaxID=2320271 RepID=A0A3A1WPQ7_9HYPH|nr:hypothetical protein [Aureimonas flava]RIX99511.1 hypothetical protein D3218_13630 [Aureimonas flava]
MRYWEGYQQEPEDEPYTYYRKGQWAVTNGGMEGTPTPKLDPSGEQEGIYQIDASVIGPQWLDHVVVKHWVDLEEFIEALRMAIKIHRKDVPSEELEKAIAAARARRQDHASIFPPEPPPRDFGVL